MQSEAVFSSDEIRGRREDRKRAVLRYGSQRTGATNKVVRADKCGLVGVFHRKIQSSAFVDRGQFNLHLVAFFDDISDFLDAAFGHL